MPSVVQGLLIVLASVAITTLFSGLVIGTLFSISWAWIAGAIFGLLYGIESGVLLAYPIKTAKGWPEMLVDLTWSLPNTVFGFLVGNIVYPFFGDLSRQESRDTGWIVYAATGRKGFGVDVLQTLGTVNLGGVGQHERMHLLQARIFGPLYLPIFGLNYVLNFFIQGLWTITLGGLLYLLKIRGTPYIQPGSDSAVGGFWGWIYYATLFERWAYTVGNPR